MVAKKEYNYSYGRFSGDGRRYVRSRSTGVSAILGLHAPISKASARMLIDEFLKSKHSIHSARASTLWVILEFCAINKITVELRSFIQDGVTVSGYEIKIVE